MEIVDRKLAEGLLEIGAVLLRPENPFTWASGWKSPIYCDNRKILSHPQLRENVCRWMADFIEKNYPQTELIAGVATGAIAHGMLVAHFLGKPFVYVRPKPKDHGTGSQIEGVLPDGAKVLVVEDLVSTGMSSLQAVDALEKAGAEVLGMTAIFTYGFPQAAEAFEKAGVRLDTLSNYPVLSSVAVEKGFINESSLETLKQWRKSPSTWKI